MMIVLDEKMDTPKKDVHEIYNTLREMQEFQQPLGPDFQNQ